MRKQTLLIAVLVMVMAAFQTLGYAELIQGRITAVDLATNSLSIQKADPMTGQTQDVKIAVPENTALKGVGSFGDLKIGDQVTVEASQDEASGILKAASVEVPVAR